MIESHLAALFFVAFGRKSRSKTAALSMQKNTIENSST
jgi:hypothetical protein